MAWRRQLRFMRGHVIAEQSGIRLARVPGQNRGESTPASVGFVGVTAPAPRLIRRVEFHFASTTKVNCNDIVSVFERQRFWCVAHVESISPQYLHRRGANLQTSMSTPFAGRSALWMPIRLRTMERLSRSVGSAVSVSGRRLLEPANPALNWDARRWGFARAEVAGLQAR